MRSSLALTPSLSEKLSNIGTKIKKGTKDSKRISDSRTLAALIEFYNDSKHLDDLVKAAVKLNQLDGRTKEGKAYRKKLIAAAEKKAEAEREAAAKKQRMKEELQAAKDYQLQLKAVRLEEERKMEEEFKIKMAQKFAEDERLEQMNAQKRRMREQ